MPIGFFNGMLHLYNQAPLGGCGEIWRSAEGDLVLLTSVEPDGTPDPGADIPDFYVGPVLERVRAATPGDARFFRSSRVRRGYFQPKRMAGLLAGGLVVSTAPMVYRSIGGDEVLVTWVAAESNEPAPSDGVFVDRVGVPVRKATHEDKASLRRSALGSEPDPTAPYLVGYFSAVQMVVKGTKGPAAEDPSDVIAMAKSLMPRIARAAMVYRTLRGEEVLVTEVREPAEGEPPHPRFADAVVVDRVDPNGFLRQATQVDLVTLRRAPLPPRPALPE